MGKKIMLIVSRKFHSSFFFSGTSRSFSTASALPSSDSVKAPLRKIKTEAASSSDSETDDQGYVDSDSDYSESAGTSTKKRKRAENSKTPAKKIKTTAAPVTEDSAFDETMEDIIMPALPTLQTPPKASQKRQQEKPKAAPKKKKRDSDEDSFVASDGERESISAESRLDRPGRARKAINYRFDESSDDD